jgi:hypothetical protein
MNRYKEYGIRRFEEQFQVSLLRKTFCSPVYYTGKGHNVIKDVMFYTDHKYNELKAKVSTYVSDEQLVYTFLPEFCTWDYLPFD